MMMSEAQIIESPPLREKEGHRGQNEVIGDYIKWRYLTVKYSYLEAGR